MKQITERIYIYSETMNRLLPIYFEVDKIPNNITLRDVKTNIDLDVNKILSGYSPSPSFESFSELKMSVSERMRSVKMYKADEIECPIISLTNPELLKVLNLIKGIKIYLDEHLYCLLYTNDVIPDWIYEKVLKKRDL